MSLPIHVALVAEQSEITPAELMQVAAALQKQVVRDFGPIWKINADVTVFPTLESLPLDYWPIVIRDEIPVDAAGYHDTDHGQPFSLVKYSPDWTLTASHECLEMLADPYGRRLVAGESPVPGQGRVQFLVEVADPSEAAQFAYDINGVTVSDFYTPQYFDPKPAAGVRYSYGGDIQHPRQVLPGGYLSWFVPSMGTWWQRTWFEGTQPLDRNLGRIDASNGNLRQAIDRLTAQHRLPAMESKTEMPVAMLQAQASQPSFGERGGFLRAAIDRAIEAAS